MAKRAKLNERTEEASSEDAVDLMADTLPDQKASKLALASKLASATSQLETTLKSEAEDRPIDGNNQSLGDDESKTKMKAWRMRRTLVLLSDTLFVKCRV